MEWRHSLNPHGLKKVPMKRKPLIGGTWVLLEKRCWTPPAEVLQQNFSTNELARCPGSALLPFWRGRPMKIYRKKGYPYSVLSTGGPSWSLDAALSLGESCLPSTWASVYCVHVFCVCKGQPAGVRIFMLTPRCLFLFEGAYKRLNYP